MPGGTATMYHAKANSGPNKKRNDGIGHDSDDPD